MRWPWQSRSSRVDHLGDEPAPIGEVHDHRPQPSGGLPARLQTWAMLGLAGAITVIVVMTHDPSPAPKPSTPSTSAQMTTTTVAGEFRRRVEDQERQLAEARRRLAEQEALLDDSLVPDRASGESAGYDPDAALRQERQRREYEALFADHVAFAARPPAAAAASGLPNATDPTWLAALALATQGKEIAPAGAAPSAPRAAPATGEAAVNDPPRSESHEPRPTPPLRADGPWHRLLEGTILEGVLTTRLSGEFAGPVQAMVTTPVYSHDARYLLIPAGARLLGSTRPVTRADERRLAVTFHRLIFPDGRSVPLERPTGLNQIGETGLKDQIDRHYLSLFGSALAIGAIAGLGNANFGIGGSDVLVIRGNDIGQAGQQVFERLMNRPPRITIREGHRLRILLTADVELPVYQPGWQPQPRAVRQTPKK